MRVGIDCHRRADDVFHDLPVFLAQSRALTAALRDAGVNRGAARAIGHAGWELLFDGALVDDDELGAAYLAAMSCAVADRDWSAALARRAARGVPTIYGDPEGVTEILWRVLGQRRLLAFDKISLAPGETGHVTLAADPRLLAEFDEAGHNWRVAPGRYCIAVGTDANDMVLRGEATLSAASIKP